METTKQFLGPRKGRGEDFAVAVMKATEPLAEEYGVEFFDWFQPMQGELVEESTDIKWVAVQMLLYWASDTGEPFEKCARRFLRQFKAELKNLKDQGFPGGPEAGGLTLEHPLRWSSHDNDQEPS